MKLERRFASRIMVLVSVAFVSACAAPPSRERPLAPVMATTSSSAQPPPALPVTIEPAKPAAHAPQVGEGAARQIADRAFARLQPALSSGARLGPGEANPICADGDCAWKWQALLGEGGVLGTLAVDSESGVVSYEPNDGRGGRLEIDAFLAREAERMVATVAVASLPVVKAYCKKVQAQHLGCLIYFEEGPSDERCAPSPPLASSCWNRVYVGEAHEGHSSRFGTFLLAPGTSRVVAASGYCDPVPLAQFSGSGSGCPK